MNRPWQLNVGLAGVVLLVAIGSAGCSKKIGDKCSTSVDCSANGDRLCDTSQPDGYCTIFNCEPDTCPSGESVCVAFTENSCLAQVGANAAPSLNRFERTFCMATCGGNSDCRGGYLCLDMGSDVVDTNPSTRRVCVVPQTAPIVVDGGSVAVCEPGDGAYLNSQVGTDSAAADVTGVDADASSPQSGADVDASTQNEGSESEVERRGDADARDAPAE